MQICTMHMWLRLQLFDLYLYFINVVWYTICDTKHTNTDVYIECKLISL